MGLLYGYRIHFSVFPAELLIPVSGNLGNWHEYEEIERHLLLESVESYREKKTMFSGIPFLAVSGPFGDPIVDNLWIVLSLFYLVWIFGWAKKYLGSAKLAILFSVIIVYLTFIEFPILVFVPVLIFLFATFGSTFFERVDVTK